MNEPGGHGWQDPATAELPGAQDNSGADGAIVHAPQVFGHSSLTLAPLCRSSHMSAAPVQSAALPPENSFMPASSSTHVKVPGTFVTLSSGTDVGWITAPLLLIALSTRCLSSCSPLPEPPRVACVGIELADLLVVLFVGCRVGISDGLSVAVC